MVFSTIFQEAWKEGAYDMNVARLRMKLRCSVSGPKVQYNRLHCGKVLRKSMHVPPVRDPDLQISLV